MRHLNTFLFVNYMRFILSHHDYDYRILVCNLINRLDLGAKQLPPDALIFFCDADVTITPDFLTRCRHNVIQGEQVLMRMKMYCFFLRSGFYMET